MAAGNETQNATRVAERRSPDRSVGRRCHGIEAGADAMVLARIDGLVRLGVFAALAVAVGVEDQRGPSLRLLLITGLVEQLGVEPPDDGPATARPQCAMRVLGEH